MPWIIEHVRREYEGVKFHQQLVMKSTPNFFTHFSFMVQGAVRLSTAPEALLAKADTSLLPRILQTLERYMEENGAAFCSLLDLESVARLAVRVASGEELEVDEPCGLDVVEHILLYAIFEKWSLAHRPELAGELDEVINFVLEYPREFSCARQVAQQWVDYENPYAISDRVKEVIDRLLTLPHHDTFDWSEQGEDEE